MLFRPDRRDFAIIGLFTGRVLLGIGGVMLVPAALGVTLGEFDAAVALVVGACTALLLGLVAEWRLGDYRDAAWHHGMAVSALAWLAGPFVGAIPLYLSGHYASYLDAYFDAMSGFATAGLAVISDLDHLSDAMNLWRHIMHFLGGQGLVLLVVSLFPGSAGAVGMYAGEAREDRILPHIARTARFIWRVSMAYFLLGGTALALSLLAAGLPVRRVPLHAVALFFAAFDTGGFALNSASVALYHSSLVELVLGVLMVAGACSFALHYQLWQGNLRELFRHVETRLLAASILGLFAVAAIGLAREGTYVSPLHVLRRGFFQVVSAHTGTGFNSVPGTLYATDWGVLAPGALVVAMAIGAMAGSTAGGIKAIRVALVGKSLRQQIRRVLLPPDAVVVERYHARRTQVVREEVVSAAGMILLLYLLLYLLGAGAGLFYGYDFDLALFESTSAAAAVGLSVGITSPTMEPGLMVVYILQMWVGRLEFIAVLALFGFAWSSVRGRV